MVAVGLLLIAVPASAITGTNNATTLANAALRNTSILSGAAFDVPASANATAVATESIAGFPANGSDYLVLSSGNATLAPNSPQGNSASVNSGGGTRGGAEDVVVLRMNLTVPAGANCLSLKFRFFSEEFPTYVGQGYNDGFLAEMDPTGPWTMTNHEITAPDNFAFMPGGAFVSINSAPMTAPNAAGTIYGGGTGLLSAATPVAPGPHALVLSVWDDGDTSLDSAAFVDDIQTFTAAPGGCVEGAVAPPADTTPPDTTITSAPSGTTGPSTSFSFTADEGSSTFECRIDGGAWGACASPKGLSGLSSGSHTFDVRATDAAGNVDTTPASHTWTVDATPPDTTLVGGPAGTTQSTSASFGFSSSEPGSTFECKLDAGAWTACTAPDAHAGLPDGSHTYSVRATDSHGNVDQTPATRTWSVDATPPNTSIVSGPSGPTSATSASFVFSASEPGSTFECELDGGSWTPCTSSTSYASITDGPHSFRVRATDAAGNVDPTPASRSWSVDITPPTTTITAGPSAATANTTAVFDFTADEPGSSFECRLDGGAWTPCTSPEGLASLADGPHTIEVRATDALGNVEVSPATRTWAVDTSAPAAPAIDLVNAPAERSGDPNPSVTFTGEPGAAFECRLDGGTWTACHSPHQLSPLTDGSHTLAIRQIDEAGNVSVAAEHGWTVDTAGPAAPTILSGPPAETTDATARFALAGEQGATLECRVDRGGWRACASSFDLDDLPLGAHLLEARQVDAAGNVSPLAEHRWRIRAVISPAPPARPRVIEGLVGAPRRGSRVPLAVVEGDRVPAACAVDAGAITHCTVTVFVDGRVVGRGTASFGPDGVRNGRVDVRLYPRMRARLARTHRVVRATFVFRAKVRGRAGQMTVRRRVVLAPRRQWVLPSDGLFESGSSALVPKVHRYLRAIAPLLRSAKRIRCVGHTDSIGTRADNRRLGMRRARAVCGQLRRLGVSAHLVIGSRGETRPRSTNSEWNGRWSNRRVALRVVR